MTRDVFTLAFVVGLVLVTFYRCGVVGLERLG